MKQKNKSENEQIKHTQTVNADKQKYTNYLLYFYFLIFLIIYICIYILHMYEFIYLLEKILKFLLGKPLKKCGLLF